MKLSGKLANNFVAHLLVEQHGSKALEKFSGEGKLASEVQRVLKGESNATIQKETSRD